MPIIAAIKSREILDSRGKPTLEVDVFLENGSSGRAMVPSGASTGMYEAFELRDNDERYQGNGVLKAVENVNKIIGPHLRGFYAFDQILIDQNLRALDGTENKHHLGANALLGVSLATARACANFLKMPFYRYIGGVYSHILPVPMMNILNGGVHADNDLEFQEFMIMPVGSGSFKEAVRYGAEVFYVLKKILKEKNLNTNVGDEGGFAPALKNAEEALDYISIAIEKAGFKLGEDIVLTLDCAATEFFKDGFYHYNGGKIQKSSLEQSAYLEKLCQNYPIFSIEDGMSEDDWEGWKILTKNLGKKCQLVGDDLFVTNVKRIKEGVYKGVANSLLVKVNQIGTLSEAMKSIDLAHKAGYTCIMSHRSGETEDSLIADLAVAVNCAQIKTGSLSRSDRLAKYNQLIRIEEELGSSASYPGKNIFKF